MNPPAPGRRLHLVYVIGTYPLLTTTFIDREIMTLRRRGVSVQVLAVRRPPEGMPLSAGQRALQDGVIYLLPPRLASLLRAQLHFAVRRPRAFFGQLAHLLTRPHPSLAARFKTLLHFGEGVYAAYRLRGQPIDELHAHFVDRAATIAWVAGRLLDRPYSLSIHAGADVYVQPVLLREKTAAARRAVTCTHYNRAHIESLIGAELSQKVTPIPHGLDFSAYRPQPGGECEPPVILAVGQLSERKGFAYLVEACARLRSQGLEFECLIVGEGPQRAALEGQIARLGLEGCVRLTGALPHEQVLALYRQASLFIMPCVQTASGDVDGIPNVLLEAMAMQIPVISTRVSAVPELVRHERNGLLVEPNDAAALAAAAARLLADRTLAQALARRGHETVTAEYDVDTNIRRFMAALWPEAVMEGEASA